MQPLTLLEWQKLPKADLAPEVIVNASEYSHLNDEWVPFTIGMQWSFINNEDCIATYHETPRDQLLLSAFRCNTDSRRRPSPPNRTSINQSLTRFWPSRDIHPHHYFQSLPSYKFVASPEGNGIDCHRHYEALFAGCIPIIEHHEGIKEKYAGCPVLYTTDYSEITPEYLERVYEEMSTKRWDFSKLLLRAYDADTQKSIKDNSSYWCTRCGGRPYSKYVKPLALPTLSLCIATFKRWAFLKENLPKYLANPYISEIIITDDEGSDVQKIRETFPDEPKLRLFINDTQLFAYKNKEEAVSKASNTWVCLMDSDNFAPLAYFEAWARKFTSMDTTQGFVFCPEKLLTTSLRYTELVDVPITRSNVSALANQTTLISLNTGNYIFEKDLYLGTLETAHDYARYDGVDVLFKNMHILMHGGALLVVKDMNYDHIVHAGSHWTLNFNETIQNEMHDRIRCLH